MRWSSTLRRRTVWIAAAVLQGTVGCAGSSGSDAPSASPSSRVEATGNQWSSVVAPTCDSVSGAAAAAGIEIAEMHDVTEVVADELPGDFTLVCNANLAGHEGMLTVQIGQTPRAVFDRSMRELAEGIFQARPLDSDALGPDAYLSHAPGRPMVTINAWFDGDQLTIALPNGDGSDDAAGHLVAFAEAFGDRLGWDVAAD